MYGGSIYFSGVPKLGVSPKKLPTVYELVVRGSKISKNRRYLMHSTTNKKKKKMRDPKVLKKRKNTIFVHLLHFNVVHLLHVTHFVDFQNLSIFKGGVYKRLKFEK